MINIVKFISIAFIVFGVIFLINPKFLKQLMNFFIKDKRIYIIGMLRIAFGIIFLLVVPDVKNALIVVIMGILFIISGILVFALGLQNVKNIINSLNNKPLFFLRCLSILPIIIGGLILYSL